MLHWWGVSAEAIAEHLGITESYLWFKTPAERAAVVESMQPYREQGLMVSFEEGEATKTRTVAHVTLIANGEEYNITEDFGYGYPQDSAEFMFEEGNYACDCNRSRMIQDVEPDFRPLDCGDTITLQKMYFTFEP